MDTLSQFSLRGKRALITGGGTGLGLGMAQAMAGAGAEVIMTGRRVDVLQEAAGSIGVGTRTYAMDVADTAAIPAFVQQVEAEAGPIHILVNNAGINLKRSIFDTSDAEAQAIFQTNLMGVYALTRAVAQGMVARGTGNILMVSSMAALFGLSQVSAYGASKAAIGGLTRVLASDLGPHGIRVNAIAPGFIESPMLRKALDADPARRDKVLGRTPLGGFGQAMDIGLAAVFLASDAARFVHGVTLAVDGGNSIGF